MIDRSIDCIITGVYLRDLTFIEEGNPNVYENGLVNFDKLHLNGLQIIDVHKHQEVILIIIYCMHIYITIIFSLNK